MVKTYPAVNLIAAHGRRIAVAAAVVVVLLSLVLFVGALVGPFGLVSGLAASGIVWAGLRLLAELVEVVAETLLPR